MIRLSQAEFDAHKERLARLKAQGTVRTHRISGQEEVLGFGHSQAGKSPQKAQKTPQRSNLETSLQAQIEAAGLPAPQYDIPYLIGTRHRLDIAWPDRRFGVEVQGMAHRIKGKFKRDIVKRATALLQGWTVLEVDGDTIASGKAIEWIGQLLKR